LIDDFEKLVADADAADLSGWGVACADGTVDGRVLRHRRGRVLAAEGDLTATTPLAKKIIK
jgi:hypothetical protein